MVFGGEYAFQQGWGQSLQGWRAGGLGLWGAKSLSGSRREEGKMKFLRWVVTKETQTPVVWS